MMKIDCSRQTWTKRTDARTLAFLELLSEPKNSTSLFTLFQSKLLENNYVNLLTLDNFSDVKLHVKIWIFAGVTNIYNHHEQKDLQQTQGASGCPCFHFFLYLHHFPLPSFTSSSEKSLKFELIDPTKLYFLNFRLKVEHILWMKFIIQNRD